MKQVYSWPPSSHTPAAMTIAWGAKVRGRWRLPGPIFFQAAEGQGGFFAPWPVERRFCFVGIRWNVDSASSYRAVKGYVHEFVNHTQKEYARGDIHENRAECLFSLLGICVKRDKLPSIAYSEELIFSMSATLQSTDRRHGIVGQERGHFPCDS